LIDFIKQIRIKLNFSGKWKNKKELAKIFEEGTRRIVT